MMLADSYMLERLKIKCEYIIQVKHLMIEITQNPGFCMHRKCMYSPPGSTSIPSRAIEEVLLAVHCAAQKWGEGDQVFQGLVTKLWSPPGAPVWVHEWVNEWILAWSLSSLHSFVFGIYWPWGSGRGPATTVSLSTTTTPLHTGTCRTHARQRSSEEAQNSWDCSWTRALKRKSRSRKHNT